MPSRAIARALARADARARGERGERGWERERRGLGREREREREREQEQEREGGASARGKIGCCNLGGGGCEMRVCLPPLRIEWGEAARAREV